MQSSSGSHFDSLYIHSFHLMCMCESPHYHTVKIQGLVSSVLYCLQCNVYSALWMHASHIRQTVTIHCTIFVMKLWFGSEFAAFLLFHCFCSAWSRVSALLKRNHDSGTPVTHWRIAGEFQAKNGWDREMAREGISSNSFSYVLP